MQNVLGQFPSMEKQENARIWQQNIDRESDRKLNISEPCHGQSCSTISLAPLPHGSLREVATPIHAPLSVHAWISLKHNSRPSHGHASNHCTAHRRVSYPFCDLFRDWMCARKDLAASAPLEDLRAVVHIVCTTSAPPAKNRTGHPNITCLRRSAGC